MKTRMMLGSMLLAVLSGSCSSSGNEAPEADSRIRLTASLAPADSRTRAAASEPYVCQVAGWEPAAEADYTTAPQWLSTTSVQADASGSPLTLSPARVYHDTRTTYIHAWHPAAAPADGVVPVTSSDGGVDVLLAGPVSGSMETPVSAPLVFHHLTTQFVFKVVGVRWPATEKLLSVTLKGVQLPSGIRLSDGTLTASAAADLPLGGLPEAGVGITTTALAVGVPLMVCPLAGNRLLVDVTTTTRRYTDIPVTTGDANFEGGKSYNTTLTFSREAVAVSATSTVIPWVEGNAWGEIVD